MDRYKEGYADADKKWRDIIENEIKKKQQKIELLHPASDCVIIDDIEIQIDILKSLLKKGE